MSTTNLFVELIVIGVGAALWLLLAVSAGLGIEPQTLRSFISVESAIPLLAIIYVLGIVTDRFADSLFEWLGTKRLRENKFPDLEAYYYARRDILTNSERLSDLLEYGRSRLRIVRGWTLNASVLACLLFLGAVGVLTLPGVPTYVALNLGAFSLLLALGCVFSWVRLANTEYKKIRSQSAYLRSKTPEAAPSVDGGSRPAVESREGG